MSEQKRNVSGKIVRSVALNMIPGYPVVKALTSAKKTIGSGAETVRDLAGDLKNQKPKSRRIRTWREAIENRPVAALPLEAIARDCLRRKRVCMVFAFICLSYAAGGLIGCNFFAVSNGILGTALPLLFIVREEHRLWQLEVGPAQPDAPLPGYWEFFRTQGIILRLLNARLF
jgi:hypothetical protein